MQAVLLAAGSSSRFYPFTDIGQKSLFRVLGKTILEHTLESLEKSKITKVLIIHGKNSPIQKLLENKRYTFTVQFTEQPDPQGMGDALLRAKVLLEEEFFVLHPHHVEFHDYKNIIQNKKSSEEELILLGNKTNSLDKFGVVRFDGDRVLEIVEKPKAGEEPSNMKVVGIYFLPKKFLAVLKNVPLDHYNFEKAISMYASSSVVRIVGAEKEVISLKFPWDLFQITKYLLNHQKRSISKNARIAKSADIVGDVVVEDGAKILEGARIIGPCYIGKKSFVGTNAIVRTYAVIEENAVVGAHMEVKNSVISKNTTTHSGFIGDSIIGENCKIAAKFTTGNVRLDRGTIKVHTKNDEVDSGLTSLGIIAGNNVTVGINVSTMPAVVIGSSTVIGPSTTVMKNIEENTKYYTKFHEVVEKSTS